MRILGHHGFRETVAPQGRGARACRDAFTACLPEPMVPQDPHTERSLP
jgi:hypothetical protein